MISKLIRKSERPLLCEISKNGRLAKSISLLLVCGPLSFIVTMTLLLLAKFVTLTFVQNFRVLCAAVYFLLLKT